MEGRFISIENAMSDTIANPNPSHWNALRKIVKRLPANLTYYGSALGAIVLAGGGQLPPGLEFVAGSIGGNMLSNMISDILKDEDLLDDEIRQRAEDAITQSDIANLLTKQDFLQGYARLIQRLGAQKNISQDILDELQTGFRKVATADQVEELKRLILQLMKQSPEVVTRKAHLFISYARKDDEPFVERLYHDLKDEFDIWWDRETMSNRGKTFLQEIRDAIDWSDRLLLVAGPRAFTSDYVRDEWQYAYETYKGINIALRLGDYANFPAQLSGFDAPDFRSDADYDERLVTLRRQLAEPVTPIGAFHNVPALPPHFLNRPNALDTLRELVIADVDKPTLISAEKRTTAVEGMGGIGKSVLAAAFAHDRKVRFSFPDGIVWLTAGRDAKLYELYRAVGVALNDDLSNYPDETTARQNAQKALTGKKCLLILDDVWELPVGRAFRDLISGTVTRLLITTRNLQINDLLNANEYRLNLIDRSQAADYLRNWVGDDPKLEEIAEKLGYLFLALKLAGARMKKDNLSGADYLRTFDRVSRMKIDRNATNRDDSLEVSITLSVDAAFVGIEDDKLLYHTFGIFREDNPIPQQTILQLWRHLRPDADEFDLLETLNALVDLALVERHEDRMLTLHDLLHSYTREKLGNRYVQTHQDLLAVYRRTQNGEGWHTARDDGYLYENLVFHLDQVGGETEKSELSRLFDDDQWMHKRLKAIYAPQPYIADLMTAWKWAENEAKAEIAANEVMKHYARCYHYALIRASINSFAANYEPYDVAAAVLKGLWTPDDALAVIDFVPNVEKRLMFFIALLETNKLSEAQRLSIEPKIYDAAQNIKDEGYRIKLLVGVAPYLSVEFKTGALNALLTIKEEAYRVKLILEFVPHLPESLNATLLAHTNQIDNPKRRNEVIRQLSPYLPTRLVSGSIIEELALVRQVDDNYARSIRLANLVPLFPQEKRAELLEEATVTAKQIQSARFRQRASEMIRTQYSQPVEVSGVINASQREQDSPSTDNKYEGSDSVKTSAITDQSHMAWALAACAPYVGDSLLEEIYVIVQRFGTRLQKNSRGENPLEKIKHPVRKTIQSGILSSSSSVNIQQRQINCLAILSEMVSKERFRVLELISSYDFHSRPLLGYDPHFIPPYASSETPHQISKSIIDICAKWQWIW